MCLTPIFFFFFFNDTATTEIYTLSLHDALPICLNDGRNQVSGRTHRDLTPTRPCKVCVLLTGSIKSGLLIEPVRSRSEEHTSELQSLAYLVCRLLLEKKKKKNAYPISSPDQVAA